MKIWAMPFDNSADTSIIWADAFVVAEHHPSFEDLKAMCIENMLKHPNWRNNETEEELKRVVGHLISTLKGFYLMDDYSYEMMACIWDEMYSQIDWDAGHMRQMNIIWQALDYNKLIKRITP